ncbi:unnamed protein product [Brachionus calyciflorus]|uniref:V-SNARE coiled-coil homology domain-containing protein n=1 Tax=Brachionus calyciflorus TaxID=104777 RepID=A0A813Y1T6_9BILA|nr:unnamed protein product [Brachionus calyciflorus]
MSMASKFSIKLANIFSNSDKKSSNSSQMSAANAELEAIQDKARKETLKLTKTSRIGFPYRPTCVAYDQVQHLLAIGNRYGYVKLYGGDSIEYTIYHSQSSTSQNFNHAASSSSLTQNLQGSTTTPNSQYPNSVLFMAFVTNEGALITYTEDSTISFWNLRQKQPGITYSRKLVNEKGSVMYLPFQSNWLYIGTEKGNTYLLNIYNNFSQSGYDVKWNNVIELTQKTKPGKVIHLSEHPLDSSKLLIGYDSGLIVLWNLKAKRGEMRFYGTAESMSSISWFYDGKQFISSHNNGSLIIWNSKNDNKPINILHPHMNESDLIPKYNMIKKVAWESNRNGDSMIIFSDGLLSTDSNIKDAITIIKNNKTRTIIEMKEKIVDFLVINNNPWTSADCPSDPSALVVLLENNLVVIDLKTEGYPLFQHHHQMNLHESPVTILEYIVDPSKTLLHHLNTSRERNLQNTLLSQQQQNQQQTNQNNTNQMGTTSSTQFLSSLPYPIDGGLKCSKLNIFSYNEIIATGHEDGTIRLWDSSGLSLTLLHKFKTHKIFDKRRSETTSIEIDMPFKITAICLHNTYLAVAAAGGHVTLYKFYSKGQNPADEELGDIPLFEIPINYELNSEMTTNTNKSPNDTTTQTLLNNAESVNKKELKCFLRTKIGYRKQFGYQPELVCLLYWSQKPPIVNNINIHTKANLLLFGTDESIVGVDYHNRAILINVSLVDFYGIQDPFHRGNRSPKKHNKSNELDESNSNDQHQHSVLQKQMTLDVHQTEANLNAASRSSSCSSLENLSQCEGVTFIKIMDYTPANTKSDIISQNPVQIWLGTTYGSVIVLNIINLAPNSENKQNAQMNNQKTTLITPTGIVHTLKGQIVDVSYLDLNPNVAQCHSIQSNDQVEDLDIDFSYLNVSQVSNSIADNFYASSYAKDNNNNNSDSNSNSCGTNSSPSPTLTPTVNAFVNPFSNPTTQVAQATNITSQSTSSIDEPPKSSKMLKKTLIGTKSIKGDYGLTQEIIDRNQYAVLTSEYQIKVISLPSNTCINKTAITEGTVAKASITVINSISYLTCYLTNGSFLIYFLPNPTLKVNLNLNSNTHLVKEKELLDRTLKTFSFSSKGHSLFMCSPSEIQKLYLSTPIGCSSLTDMLSEFFDPKVPCPVQPKPNIFKSLFSNSPVDREELFGESSGKPSACIIKNVEGDVHKAKKEMTELQKLAMERGEKLSALELKSEQMTQAASAFAKNASDLANKYKNKNKFF